MYYTQDIFGRPLFPASMTQFPIQAGLVAQDPRIPQTALAGAVTQPFATWPLGATQGVGTLPVIGSFVPQIPQVAPTFATGLTAQPINPWVSLLDPRLAAQTVNPWATAVHPALLDPRIVAGLQAANPWSMLFPQTAHYPFLRPAYLGGVAQTVIPQVAAGCVQ
jgi:hypothetical protein